MAGPTPPTEMPTRTPAVTMLTTLLRSLQSYTDLQDTPRLLGTAAALLSTLTNPLNLTVLTSQLVTAPAFWAHPDGLRTCQSVMGVFHSAAMAIARAESDQTGNPRARMSGGLAVPGSTGGMTRQEWTKAVVEGADERSDRWKHLLVVGGLLSGFATAAKQSLGQKTRSWWRADGDHTLQAGLRADLVDRLNETVGQFAANSKTDEDEMSAGCVAVVLTHVLPHLPDQDRRDIRFDDVAPVLVSAAFLSREGFWSAYIIGKIDNDVVELPDGKLSWPQMSGSFEGLSKMATRPLVQNVGQLATLIATAVDRADDPATVRAVLDTVLGFSKSVVTQWRINRLSAIDQVDEHDGLDGETCSQTTPPLWAVLKKAMLSVVVVLRAVAARLISDPALAGDDVAPVMASQIIHTLRNLCFLSSRFSVDVVGPYKFAFLSAIDVLSGYPDRVEAVVRETQPLEPGHIPHLPLDRNLDLFFLNLAEHLTPSLCGPTTEQILIAAATPYLGYGRNDGDGESSETNRHRKQRLMPLFEAAHSVMLSVFSASAGPPVSTVEAGVAVGLPRAELATKYVPFYADTLFGAFPDSLSARQFRLAFRTLTKVLTTPTIPPAGSAGRWAGSSGGNVSAGEELVPVLLEIVSSRAQTASSRLLPVSAESGQLVQPERFSERSTLVLSLIDVLPSLPVSMLDEWLPITAGLVNSFPSVSEATDPEDEFGPAATKLCRDHFWNSLINGEMGPIRAQRCMTWWTTLGGRELVLGLPLFRQPGPKERVARDSRL